MWDEFGKCACWSSSRDKALGSLFVGILLVVVLCGSAQAEEVRPNVLLVVCDDLGWGDLGCYGNQKIRTPNVDRLAREGVRFTQFYAAGVQCTPSRAGLLTGRYPARFGVTFAYMEGAGGIPKSEVLLPELLKQSGYRTGLVGKWHLGDRPEDHPVKHGFDRFVGLLRGHDVGKREVWEDGKLIAADAPAEELTERWTAAAEKFIETESARGPWFLMLGHTSPHVPLAVGEKFRGRSKAGTYADAVEEIDDSMGRLIAAIEKTKVGGRTVVMFTSDNGPAVDQGKRGGSTGGLRGGKYSVYEGGVRVPMVAWWPGRWKAREENTPASLLDVMPTCVGLADGKLPLDRTIDGRDLRGLLAEQGRRDGDVFFHFFRDEIRGVRAGDWKWVREEGREKLFDLRGDPQESREVGRANSEVMREMRERVAKMKREIETSEPARK